MSQKTTAVLIAALAAAGLLLSACSSGGTESGGAADSENAGDATVAEQTDESDAGAGAGGTDSGDADSGNEGRAFDSTDDAVITAIESALADKNAKAHWDGSRLVVALDGSVDDPTAPLWCTAAEGIISDSEQATLVYSDGDIPCEDR
ncbi:MAG: hypothetical protein WDA07_14630 [Leucobacter sp.]